MFFILILKIYENHKPYIILIILINDYYIFSQSFTNLHHSCWAYDEKIHLKS